MLVDVLLLELLALELEVLPFVTLLELELLLPVTLPEPELLLFVTSLELELLLPEVPEPEELLPWLELLDDPPELDALSEPLEADSLAPLPEADDVGDVVELVPPLLTVTVGGKLVPLGGMVGPHAARVSARSGTAVAQPSELRIGAPPRRRSVCANRGPPSSARRGERPLQSARVPWRIARGSRRTDRR